jgi:uncharacterized protein YbaP (TraB family)
LRASLGGLVSLLAACSFLGCAGSPQPALPPANAFELRAEHAFFWEGTPPGEETPRLYLLGSVHMLDQPLVLGPEIARAFDRAGVLVLEVDLEAVDEETRIDMGLRYAILEWGETLEDFVSPETMQLLEAWLDSASLTSQERAAYYRNRPWSLAGAIVDRALEESGAHRELGVEAYFLGLADGRKRVTGLETIDEHTYSPSSFSQPLQEEMLLQALAGGDMQAFVKQLLEAWKRGDDEDLLALAIGAEASEEYLETVLYARNELMVERLMELLAEQPDATCFVIVGASHVVGPLSVVEMLESEGFTLRRGSAR